MVRPALCLVLAAFLSAYSASGAGTVLVVHGLGANDALVFGGQFLPSLGGVLSLMGEHRFEFLMRRHGWGILFFAFSQAADDQGFRPVRHFV